MVRSNGDKLKAEMEALRKELSNSQSKCKQLESSNSQLVETNETLSAKVGAFERKTQSSIELLQQTIGILR